MGIFAQLHTGRYEHRLKIDLSDRMNVELSQRLPPQKLNDSGKIASARARRLKEAVKRRRLRTKRRRRPSGLRRTLCQLQIL